jgi:NADH-quinone oxidoreductase subunit L
VRGAVGFVRGGGAAVLAMRHLAPDDRIFQLTVFTWIAAGDVRVDVSYWIDALSMTMLLVVTGIGRSFISIRRPTCTAIAASRAFLRLPESLHVLDAHTGDARACPLLFVGWEGVGLCSYLLIGFWYQDIANAAAARRRSS